MVLVGNHLIFSSHLSSSAHGNPLAVELTRCAAKPVRGVGRKAGGTREDAAQAQGCRQTETPLAARRRPSHLTSEIGARGLSRFSEVLFTGEPARQRRGPGGAGCAAGGRREPRPLTPPACRLAGRQAGSTQAAAGDLPAPSLAT